MVLVYVYCDCVSVKGLLSWPDRYHYCLGEYCPNSGWIIPFTDEIHQAVNRLTEEGKPISMGSLAAAGLSPEALARVFLVEVAEGAPVFQWFQVEGGGMSLSGYRNPAISSSHSPWWAFWRRRG